MYKVMEEIEWWQWWRGCIFEIIHKHK